MTSIPSLIYLWRCHCQWHQGLLSSCFIYGDVTVNDIKTFFLPALYLEMSLLMTSRPSFFLFYTWRCHCQWHQYLPSFFLFYTWRCHCQWHQDLLSSYFIFGDVTVNDIKTFFLLYLWRCHGQWHQDLLSALFIYK